MGFSFRVTSSFPGSLARAGRIETDHGVVETPAFFPVGTQATVKTVTPDELRALGATGILANTYHLFLRPGPAVIEALGGLHRFMGWSGPIMTDSGGYQAFSLGFALEHGVGKIAKTFPGGAAAPDRPVRARLARIDEGGITFASHRDGTRYLLSPERSIQIQQQLGADLILAFDECTSPLSDEAYTRQAMERTHRWAIRSLEAFQPGPRGLYGIVQGGAYADLRDRSARFIGGLPFAGLAIGGSLGRSKEDMHRVLEWTIPLLPSDKPRHLLGIGDPADFFTGVERGIDTFDCVAATRLARHGSLYTRRGRLNVVSARFRQDPAPIEVDCRCYTCRTFSRAYLRHLLVANEILGYRLATLHNLHFSLNLLAGIRRSISDGSFVQLRDEFVAGYQSG